jgi:hypothetical protein
VWEVGTKEDNTIGMGVHQDRARGRRPRVREANTQQLRRELAGIGFKPRESVDDFLLHLDTLANKLRIMGGDIE